MLSKIGFDERFLRVLSTMYRNPLAQDKANGIRSQSFCLMRDTQQECSLLPLLFAMAIEPLAEGIRSNNDITGILLGEQEHKIPCVDDLVLYMKNPQQSLPVIQNLLQSFGQVLGLYAKPAKTELHPIYISVDLAEKYWWSYIYKWIERS